MGWGRTLLVVVLSALTTSLSADAQAPSRVALVVANGAYVSVPRLENPARDATLVANALRTAGFATTSVRNDLNKAAFEAALRDFKRQADAADIALIYFAGHGIELEQQNWLLPVDARLDDVADVHTEGISLDTVLRMTSGARRLRIVVLDACRDNPFALRLSSPTRSVTRGLRPVENLPRGTLLAYSASSGQRASDGDRGSNSPFARALATRLVEPGVEVRFIFARVRDDVISRNAGNAAADAPSQEPWIGSSLSAEEVVFVPPVTATPRPTNDIAASAARARAALAAVTDQEWSTAPLLPLIQRVVGASDEMGFRNLAEAGDPKAMLMLGYAIGGIAGYRYDGAESVRLIKAASDKGFAPAMFAYASLLKRPNIPGLNQDLAGALMLVRRAAAAGNAHAQYDLGQAYFTGGPGLTINTAEHVRLTQLAAAQGHATAQSVIGSHYEYGRLGFRRDEREALRLFRLSAGQGDSTGQAYLASFHLNAQGGLPQNSAEGLRLMRLAADQNMPYALDFLGTIYSEGRHAVTKNETTALSYFQRAALLGSPSALVHLGAYYEDGRGGLARNPVQAVALYQVAASSNEPDGLFHMGRAHESGTGGVARSRSRAVDYYRRAVTAGSSQARTRLQEMGERP
jgi:TPR repeat protein/uncharacterized caspase-like protein